MLVAVFLYIIFQRFTFDIEDSNLEVNTTIKCTPYKELLPDGYCIDILHNKLIGQKKEYADLIDGNLKLSIATGYNLVESGKYVEEDRHNMLNEIVSECQKQCNSSVVPRIKSLLYSIDSSIEEVQASTDCIVKSKWFACHFVHQTCLENKNNFNVIPSPPCIEVINNLKQKSYCSYALGEFSSIMYQIHLLCPKLFAGETMNFQAYPSLNKSSIETCQNKNPERKKHDNTMQDSSCFIGKGAHYSGFVNITQSGRSCQPWSLNPFLDNITYPLLQENYCRNPQSYGEYPWCFVDYEKRKWEYCHVEKCIDEDEKPNGLRLEYVAASLLILPIVIFLLIYRYRVKVSPRKMEILPTYTIPLDSVSSPTNDLNTTTDMLTSNKEQNNNEAIQEPAVSNDMLYVVTLNEEINYIDNSNFSNNETGEKTKKSSNEDILNEKPVTLSGSTENYLSKSSDLLYTVTLNKTVDNDRFN